MRFFSDISFFLEPFLIGYIFYVIFAFSDFITLFSAIAVISGYMALNLLLENTLTLKEKLLLLPFVPSMYVFFYMLSYVEYYALIKMIIGLPKLKESLSAKICTWTHVARARKLQTA